MTTFCTRCGGPLENHAACASDARPGAALDPVRFCGDCGAKLTVQVLPGGYEARCLRCERRARFAAAREERSRGAGPASTAA